MARTPLSRGGDYVPPDGNIVARRIFIDAVVRLVPEVVQELEALAKTLPDFDAGPGWVGSLTLPPALRAWCVRRGFTQTRWIQADVDRSGTLSDIPFGPDWLLELAGHTVRALRDPAETKGAGDILRRSIWVMYAPINAPTFTNPFWNPDVETERAFRDRVDAYILSVNQSTAIAGRVPARRAKDPIREFEWLALFQVGHLEMAEIREQRRSPRQIATDAMLDAIRVAAAEAGVHLRPVPRGRPRGR